MWITKLAESQLRVSWEIWASAEPSDRILALSPPPYHQYSRNWWQFSSTQLQHPEKNSTINDCVLSFYCSYKEECVRLVHLKFPLRKYWIVVGHRGIIWLKSGQNVSIQWWKLGQMGEKWEFTIMFWVCCFKNWKMGIIKNTLF